MNKQVSKLSSRIEIIITDFISHIEIVQPDLIEGIYLTGSIPLGDYYSNKSDIDFLTILKEKPKESIYNHFEQIHQCIEHKYNRPNLNGYYLTLEGIQKKQKSFPSYFRSRMQFDRPFELDRVTLFELQTISLCVFGKPVIDLPIQVSFEDVILQLHQNINEYWTTWIKKHSVFKIGYLLLVLFPQLTEWGILGIARQYYTLEKGEITSKLKAGLYCLDKLPDYYHDIIMTAIETRKHNNIQHRSSFKRARKTIECMNFIVNDFNNTYNKRNNANR